MAEPLEAVIEEIPELEQVQSTGGNNKDEISFDPAMLQQTLQQLQQQQGGGGGGEISSKMRKQYFKTMQRLGFKQIASVRHVRLSGGSGTMAVNVSSPEVYRYPGTNSFFIFGKPQMDQTQLLAEMFKQQNNSKAKTEETKEEEEEAVDDDGGVSAEEIQVVMSQTDVTREKAIKALKENQNDIVNAIMSLTV